MRWPLYVALGAALAGLRESAAVPWFMVAVGLLASTLGLGVGLVASGLASLLLFFQGVLDLFALAAHPSLSVKTIPYGGVVGRAYRAGKPIYVSDVRRDPDYIAPRATRPSPSSPCPSWSGERWWRSSTWSGISLSPRRSGRAWNASPRR